MSSCLVHFGFIICLHGAQAAGAPPDVPGDPCDYAQQLVLAGSDFATLYAGRSRDWDNLVAEIMAWNQKNLEAKCSAPPRPEFEIPKGGIPELRVPGSG